MILRRHDMGWGFRLGMAIDRGIGIFAPGMARRRMASRVGLHLIQRAVAGGAPDRTNATKNPSRQGPVNKVKQVLVPTRAQARDLYLRNPYARGTINSITANLIGIGMRPQPLVKRPKMDDMDERFNDTAEEEWGFFADACGPSGSENIYELQRQVMKEILVPGEGILVMSTPKDGRRVPFAVECVSSERLADLNEEPRKGNRIIQGVEVDAEGRRLAYWIYKNHPGDSMVLVDKPQRIPAERVIHAYDELEPGQVRGLTRLITCAGAFDALMQLMDFQLTRARVASAFALMITDDGSAVRIVGQPEINDDRPEDIESLEGGMIFRGRQGEGITGVGPAIQDTQLDPFVVIIIRMIARGLDVSYEVASRDYSKVTYLSARAGENQDRRHDEPQQAFLNARVNRPIYGQFIRTAALAGRLRIGEPIERYCAVQFHAQERPWIDPLKDAQADTLAIQGGLMSPIEAVAKRGKDAYKILKDLQQWKKWAKDLGLELTVLPPKAAPTGPVSVDEEDEEQVEDNGKKKKAQAA